MATCRPTSMMLVPRILNMAHETYKLKRAALLAAAGLVESEDDDAPKRVEIAKLDRQARDHVRDAVFGGRLLFQLVGSAPSSPEVMEVIRDCNGVPFVEGYGSTGA
jgi:long-subunit acyl-CoA synthetase (AMP-forming)